jgi:hypothetical protein
VQAANEFAGTELSVDNNHEGRTEVVALAVASSPPVTSQVGDEWKWSWDRPDVVEVARPRLVRDQLRQSRHAFMLRGVMMVLMDYPNTMT